MAGQARPAAAGSRVSVDVGNAGTVLRFLPAVAALTAAEVAFDGDERIRARPIGPILAALRQLGARIEDGGRGAAPFSVLGRGAVRGGPVTLDASESSQLISGLLLAAPRFEEGIEVRHEGPPVPSAPHIAMTVRMLQAAGAEVSHPDGPRPDRWLVRPGRLELGAVTVEPDLSNAGPFLAAALVTGGTITVPGWPQDSLQAAGPILDVLARMGARCEAGPDGMTITGPGTITGIEADLRDVAELAPVLTAAAALAGTPSVFTGLAHTRRHETDRLAALAKEINSLGGDITELPDGLQIRPRPLRAGGRAVRQLRRSPDGDGGGRAGPARAGPAGGQCADGGQDLPRVRRRVVRHAVRGGRSRNLTVSPRPGYANLDEDDVRVRPGRGSRPRTRRRPAHSAAMAGFVTTVDRGRYGCVTDDGLVVAMKARELGKGSVVVGDQVALAGDTSGAGGTLARIVRVEPRTSALRRSPDDTDPAERIIVANADQMVIVCALAQPPPGLRFIDRCLVAAYDGGLDPLLLLTKADLAPKSAPSKIRALYAPLDLPVLTTRRPLPARTLSRVRNRLTGRLSVLIGQSGVGKSTLVNTLIPAAERSTGVVNPVTGRGQAHLIVGGGPAAGRRVDHRHAGTARLRAGTHQPGPGGGGVRGPGRGHGRVPVRLRSPVPRLRPGRLGPRASRRGAPGFAAPPAAQPRGYAGDWPG